VPPAWTRQSTHVLRGAAAPPGELAAGRVPISAPTLAAVAGLVELPDHGRAQIVDLASDAGAAGAPCHGLQERLQAGIVAESEEGSMSAGTADPVQLGDGR